MQFEDKTMENIMIDLLADIGDDVGKEEGTLVNHAL